MILILLGMKHCGKTTVGALVAARWNCPLYDVDDLTEVVHQARTGRFQSVREIFGALGEEAFTHLEAQACIELGKLLERPATSAVVALGGRTALNERARHILDHVPAVKVYLRLDPEEAFRRTMAHGLPPFLDAADPRGSFRRLFQQRRPIYEKMADVAVDVDGLTPEAAAEAVLAAIQERTDGGQ